MFRLSYFIIVALGIINSNQEKLSQDSFHQISSLIPQDTCIGQYLNGKKEGLWTCWYEYDKRYHETIYHQGKKHGIRKVYADSTRKKLLFMDSFFEGKRQGTYTSFHKNGQPNYVAYFNKGRYEYEALYDTTGMLFMAGGLMLDSIPVKEISFDPVTYKETITMKKDLLEVRHGTWSFYEKGELIKTYVYDKGTVIDSTIVK